MNADASQRVASHADLRRLAGTRQRHLEVHLGPLRRVPGHLWFPDLQDTLRPGGEAVLLLRNTTRSELRRLGRDASHYFDVDQPWSNALRLVRRPTAATVAHFEELAPHYAAQIPAHVQAHFLDRKISIIEEFVGPLQGKTGLDLGAGVGMYAQELARRSGARVVGIDPSAAAIKEAAKTPVHNALFVHGDALRLPFRDGSFDFAYTINVVHHLKRGEQERALAELRRVLRPSGVLVVHEMNTRNPIFRGYLRHVYPRIRPIDKGDEEFVHPDRWPLGPGWSVENVRYITFVPDFVPGFLMGPFRRLERILENGRAAPYAAHYAVALRRAT